MSADSICRLVESRMRMLKDIYPQELAKQGCEVANQAFGSMTSAMLDKNRFSISGTEGMIAEFGAGLATDENHEFAKDMQTFDVRRGSYSDANEGEYQRTGYKFWHFAGKKIFSTVPRRGMYLGMKNMREHLDDAYEKAIKK